MRPQTDAHCPRHRSVRRFPGFSFKLQTYIGVALALVAAAALASLLPATRATRVDPVQTLRTD